MKKNIFYVSNTQEKLFPENTRTNFNQYIDINDLDYIQSDDIEVAIKAISFDTRQYVQIEMNLTQPHFIIKQTLNDEEVDTHKNFLESKGLVGSKKFTTTENFIEDFIDITKPNDYIICNRFFDVNRGGFSDMNYLIEQKYNRRNFSNIILVDQNKIIHHIYLHNTKFYFLDRFIENINDVIKDISFYHGNISIKKNLIETRFTSLTHPRINPILFPILIRNDIGSILGLKCEKKLGNKMLDFFHGGLMETQSKSLGLYPSSLFVTDIYLKEQNLVYFEVSKENSVSSENPSLIPSTLYEIRSNISDWSIYNARYDRLMGFFRDKRKQEVIYVEFQNPSFFKTRKEQLSNAKFDIGAVILDGTRKFSIGSPTYIQLFVRKSKVEMKRPFNIFLDSSCPISKELYPQNKNTDFIIELPERLKFRMNWTVTLKTLFLSNQIHNIEDCGIAYQYANSKNELLIEKKFFLKNGHYKNLKSFINEIADGFRKERMPFIIKEEKNGRAKIAITRKIKSRSKVNFIMTKYLACILGYTSSPKEVQFLRFDENVEYIAPHEPNLFLTYPRNLIIGCDIVENTIFGGQPFKLLRLVTNSDNLDSDILSFDFLQDEKVALKVREFKSIRIVILDATGAPVKSESNFPTRLQLMFSLE